ncbi:hypothetical protein HOC01_01100 [archaeon]|jgi:hypothetical protein|nr:hypothetical protein [archaeon]MBT6698560.1 hypothetical protein [archaeon]
MVNRFKFSLLSVIFVLVVLMSSVGVFAALSTSDFTISLLDQNPDPVEPGETVRIEIQIQNDGTSTDDDVIVHIEPSYPLSVYGDSEVNIGRLRSGSLSQSVEFDLLVANGAIEGNAEFDVYLELAGTEAFERTTLTVDIDTYDARLDISNVELDPMPVLAGQEASLIVTLSNKADSLLKSITASLDFDDDDLPFAPYQSSSEKTVGNLGAGNAVGLQYKIYVDPSAEPGLYKVPLTLDYSDNAGASYSTEELVTILVGANLDLDIQVRNSEIWRGAKTGDVTFEIQNKGLGEIKSATLSLVDSTDGSYEVIGSQSSFYLGNVDADDTETEELTLKINSRKDVELIVMLSYLDSLNVEQSEEFIVNLAVPSKSEAVALGLTNGSGVGKFVVLLILAGAGYWYWRKKKKQKESLAEKSIHHATSKVSGSSSKGKKR